MDITSCSARSNKAVVIVGLAMFAAIAAYNTASSSALPATSERRSEVLATKVSCAVNLASSTSVVTKPYNAPQALRQLGDIRSFDFDWGEPDEWTLRRNVSRLPGAGTNHRAPPAYIITGDTSGPRYRVVAVRAAAAGLRPLPHMARWPSEDVLRSKTHRVACLTKHAHFNAWRRFAEDPAYGDGDFGFFFEDDVAFTPPLTPDVVQRGWRSALKHASVARRGVLWLGGCVENPGQVHAVATAGADQQDEEWRPQAVPQNVTDPWGITAGGVDALREAHNQVLSYLAARFVSERTAAAAADKRRVLKQTNNGSSRDSATDSSSDGNLGDEGAASSDHKFSHRHQIEKEELPSATISVEQQQQRQRPHQQLPSSEGPRRLGSSGGSSGKPPLSLGPFDLPEASYNDAAGGGGGGKKVLTLRTLPDCALCVHAYALRKDVASYLEARIAQLQPGAAERCDVLLAIARGHDPFDGKEPSYADLLVQRPCRLDWRGLPILGAELMSPLSKEHVGVFYQDRGSFHSIVSGDGVTTTRFRKEPWETDADFE